MWSKLKTLPPYFGGKRRLLGRIFKHVPKPEETPVLVPVASRENVTVPRIAIFARHARSDSCLGQIPASFRQVMVPGHPSRSSET